MGHQLQDVDLGIFLSRLREKKTPVWHRVGRLKRGDWPKNVGKGSASFFLERHLAAGRLLCDLANDMGKSTMTACQSWSLDEMVSVCIVFIQLVAKIEHAIGLPCQNWSTRQIRYLLREQSSEHVAPWSSGGDTHDASPPIHRHTPTHRRCFPHCPSAGVHPKKHSGLWCQCPWHPPWLVPWSWLDVTVAMWVLMNTFSC